MSRLFIVAASLFLSSQAWAEWELMDSPEGYDPQPAALSPKALVVFVEDPNRASKMMFLAQKPVTIQLAFVAYCSTGEEELQMYFPLYEPAFELTQDTDGRHLATWPVSWVGQTKDLDVARPVSILRLWLKNKSMLPVTNRADVLEYIMSHKTLVTGFNWQQEGFVFTGIDLEGAADAIEQTRRKCQ